MPAQERLTAETLLIEKRLNKTAAAQPGNRSKKGAAQNTAADPEVVKALQAELQRSQAAHAQLTESSQAQVARLRGQLQEARQKAVKAQEDLIEYRVGADQIHQELENEVEQANEERDAATWEARESAIEADALRGQNNELQERLHTLEAQVQNYELEKAQQAENGARLMELLTADVEKLQQEQAARELKDAEAQRVREELAFVQRVARSAAQKAAAQQREVAAELAATRAALAAEAARADAVEAAFEQLNAGFQRRLNEALVQQKVRCSHCPHQWGAVLLVHVFLCPHRP